MLLEVGDIEWTLGSSEERCSSFSNAHIKKVQPVFSERGIHHHFEMRNALVGHQEQEFLLRSEDAELAPELWLRVNIHLGV